MIALICTCTKKESYCYVHGIESIYVACNGSLFSDGSRCGLYGQKTS